jgi:hypothetical protein
MSDASSDRCCRISVTQQQQQQQCICQMSPFSFSETATLRRKIKRKGKMSKIFVSGLPTSLAAADAKAHLLAAFPGSTDVTIPLAGTNKTKTKGVAFVSFGSAEDAAAALQRTGASVDVCGVAAGVRMSTTPLNPAPSPRPVLPGSAADVHLAGPSPKAGHRAPAAEPRLPLALPASLLALNAVCCIALPSVLDSGVDAEIRRLVAPLCEVEAVHRTAGMTVVVLSRSEAVAGAIAALSSVGVFSVCRGPLLSSLFGTRVSSADRKREREVPLGEALAAIGAALRGESDWEGIFMDSDGSIVVLRRPSYAQNA